MKYDFLGKFLNHFGKLPDNNKELARFILFGKR